MSILKPVDHQNIALRLLARTSACDPQHLTVLAQAYKLSVSLHQMRVACDELVTQQFAARVPYGYRLTADGDRELADVPLLTSYHLPCDDERADREASMIVAIEGDRHDAQ